MWQNLFEHKPAPEIYFAFRGRLGMGLRRPPLESTYISGASIVHCSSFQLVLLVISQPHSLDILII